MTALTNLERELNPQQLEAVLCVDRPLLIFAGAGSGKTRVITYRAAHIVAAHRVAAYRVMCVTFTNKATGEMRERVTRLLGEAPAKEMWVSTFHATGARLLRRFHAQAGLQRDFVIYDESDQRVVMNRVYDSANLSEDLVPPRSALAAIGRLKQDLLSPAEFADRAKSDQENLIAVAYANYEHALKANNAVDFDDLLKRTVDLLEDDEETRKTLQGRFVHVMVDEFQDTNAAQYRILRSLIGPTGHVCVVGDDDQSIYGWRGADIRNIGFFRHDYPNANVVKLERNYRSTGRILQAANGVIQQLKAREPKVLFTENDVGGLVELVPTTDERDEALRVASRIMAARKRGTALREMAVFYRIHAQSRPLEEAMRAANLPYVVIGGMRFYERAEVKDVLSYLRMLVNPHDDVSFLRVVNQPTRGIGKTTLDRLSVHARSRSGSLWSVLLSGDLPADLGPARKRLEEFRDLIVRLQTDAREVWKRPEDIARAVLEHSKYRQMLEDDPSVDAQGRRENVEELIGSMHQYAEEDPEPSLTGYLERVTLDDVATTDDADSDDKVSLMTVHGAKGLEFDTVFVTGMEDGMFPYRGTQAGADPEDLAEERRLAYVAITRARKQLVLSFTRYRQIFGRTRSDPPSRFLYEIPDGVLTMPPPGKVVERAEEPRKPAKEGFHIEYDEPTIPQSNLRNGMRVMHPKFGEGRVVHVEFGADVKVVVYFLKLGEQKKVLAEFVKPL